MADNFITFFEATSDTTTPAASAQPGRWQKTKNAIASGVNALQQKAIKDIENPSFATRLVTRMGGGKIERDVKKEFVVPNLAALLKTIEAQENGILPLTSINGSLIPQNILSQITNTVKRDLEADEAILITTSTKDQSVTIANINGVWSAYKTDQKRSERDISIVVFDVSKLIDAINARGKSGIFKDRKVWTLNRKDAAAAFKELIPEEDKLAQLQKLLDNPTPVPDQKIIISNPAGTDSVTLFYSQNQWLVFSSIAPIPELVIKISEMPLLISLLRNNENDNLEIAKRNGINTTNRPNKFKKASLDHFFMPLHLKTIQQQADQPEFFKEEETEMSDAERKEIELTIKFLSILDISERVRFKNLVNTLSDKDAQTSNFEIKRQGSSTTINIGNIDGKLYAYAKIPTEKESQGYVNNYTKIIAPPEVSKVIPTVEPNLPNIVTRTSGIETKPRTRSYYAENNGFSSIFEKALKRFD